jgi:hypothetical protein
MPADPPPPPPSRPALFEAVGQLADSLGAPAEVAAQLASLCATARLAFGAAAVSVARIVEGPDGGGLHYEAADGEGAEAIVGVRLPSGQGIAGYVAATGQAMAVDRVADDPRFAHGVAESTGYVPTTLLVVPVIGDGGEPIGVLSVLDRSSEVGPAPPARRASSGGGGLELATAFAAQAGLVLPTVDHVARLGPVLLRAMADALVAGSAPGEPTSAPAPAPRAESTDTGDETAVRQLADALRRAAQTASPADVELVELAASLAELQTRPSEVRASAGRVLAELLVLSEPRRRR